MKYPFAVIQIGTHQHLVTPGQLITIDQTSNQPGDVTSFDNILLYSDGNNIKLGHPIIKNISIKAQIVKHHKGHKIKSATYKAKSRSRRLVGHRSRLTQIQIKSIS